jgi:hypothetical protein
MEGLFLILGDLLAGVIAPLLAAAVALLASVLGLVLEGVLLGIEAWTGRRWRSTAQAGSVASQPVATKPPGPKGPWRRRALIAALIGTAAVGLALVIANAFFAERILGWGIERWSRRSGVAIVYDGARCGLLSGTAHLEHLRLGSPSDVRNAYALTIERVDVDVAVLALLRGAIAVESVEIAGVRGSVAADLDAPRQAGGKRGFTTDRFVLDDARIDFTLTRHGRTISGPLVIARLETAPLRRSWLLFDALFRSQARGSVWGAPFEIASRPVDAGRATTWTARGVPVELLAAYVGGPCAWLRAGRVDIDVDDRWSLDAPKYIHMDYHLVGHALEMQPANELGGLNARLDRAMAAFLAAKDGELDLACALDVDPERFHGAASLDAVGLWEALSPMLGAEIAKELGWTPAEAELARRALAAAARATLEHWRKH